MGEYDIETGKIVASKKMPQTDSLMGYVHKAVASSEQIMATLVLNSLRRIRDNSPNEWDALMKTEAGKQMLALCYFLKGLEKGE